MEIWVPVIGIWQKSLAIQSFSDPSFAKPAILDGPSIMSNT